MRPPHAAPVIASISTCSSCHCSRSRVSTSPTTARTGGATKPAIDHAHDSRVPLSCTGNVRLRGKALTHRYPRCTTARGPHILNMLPATVHLRRRNTAGVHGDRSCICHKFTRSDTFQQHQGFPTACGDSKALESAENRRFAGRDASPLTGRHLAPPPPPLILAATQTPKHADRR